MLLFFCFVVVFLIFLLMIFEKQCLKNRNMKDIEMGKGFIVLNMQVSVPGERKQEFGYWAIELHLIV